MQETQHTQQKDTQTAQDTVKHRNSMDATLIQKKPDTHRNKNKHFLIENAWN